MTEEEKCEKAIEEMTTILDEVDCQDHNVCVERRNISCNRCCAERLSDYVLHKEKEVQKEMTKKFIEFIKENSYCTIDNELIKEACEKFGAEVEESERT